MTILTSRLLGRPAPTFNISVIGAGMLITALIGLSWVALTWLE
jgi:hypothetical protein